MTTSLDNVPKKVKELPDEGQRIWVEAYNKDYGWRCSEAHAEKAAWRAVTLAGFELPAAPPAKKSG